MATLLLLVSGWLGLVFAVADGLMTGGSFAQFLGVWTLCGMTSFSVLWGSTLVRSGRALAQPDHG